MLFFRNLLKLPTPVDLGWSKSNALASSRFSDNPKGKTWENWHETVKEMHPVRYWVAETAADFIRYNIWFPIQRPFVKVHYWLVSHLIPSRRYHMLDLRQPCVKGSKQECYSYGWCDVPEKMLYAMFNLLGEYLNKEEPQEPSQWMTHEQIEADEDFKRQQANLDEANNIYYWWTVTRHTEVATCNKLLEDWAEAHKNKETNRAELLRTMLEAQEKFNEDKIDEMVARLMKIRRSLWT